MGLRFELVKLLLSLPAWGGWIEISPLFYNSNIWMSLPAWGGWIEIVARLLKLTEIIVPPRMGRVD